jgi:hypothetical protein
MTRDPNQPFTFGVTPPLQPLSYAVAIGRPGLLTVVAIFGIVIACLSGLASLFQMAVTTRINRTLKTFTTPPAPPPPKNPTPPPAPRPRPLSISPSTTTIPNSACPPPSEKSSSTPF